MKIKRFFAKDMRTALAEVKETLGPDAVIMSNKKVSGGIEIVAAVDYQAQPSPMPEVRRDVRDDSVNLSSRGHQVEPSVGPNLGNGQKNDDAQSFPDSLSALLARQQQIQNQQVSQPRGGDVPKTLAEQAAFVEPAAPRRPAPRPAPTQSRDKDLEAMREDQDLIDKWVEGEERCTASIDVDTAWDVLRHILDEVGFRSDGVADGVLSNGCDFVSPELVKEQAKELATWSRARVREALRAIDEDAGLYHQAVYQREEGDLIDQYDELSAFFQEAAERGDGALFYGA